jgi:polysaccharide pyruvyl transferase WcaK-like protein
MLIACVRDLYDKMPSARIVVLVEAPERCIEFGSLAGCEVARSLNECFTAPMGWGNIRKCADALSNGSLSSWAYQRRGERLVKTVRALRDENVPSSWLSDGTLETLKLFAEADAVFDVGGANLNEIWKSYFYEKCFSFLIAKALGKPLILSGQSMEPIRNSVDRKLLKKALSGADTITFRENISEKYVRSLGVSAPRMETTGDDALSLEAASLDEVKAIHASENLPDDVPLIGFQFRDYLELKSPGAYRKLAKMLDALVSELGVHVVTIPMHFARCDERGHIDRITDKMTHSDAVHRIRGEYTPSELKGLVGSMTMNVGISYHFYIFSASTGVPILPVYRGAHYKQKMLGLTALFELPDTALALDEISVEAFVQKVRETLDRRSAISDHLKTQVARMLPRVMSSRDRCRELLLGTEPGA